MVAARIRGRDLTSTPSIFTNVKARSVAVSDRYALLAMKERFYGEIRFEASASYSAPDTRRESTSD
jgi:hypothetical protein